MLGNQPHLFEGPAFRTRRAFVSIRTRCRAKRELPQFAPRSDARLVAKRGDRALQQSFVKKVADLPRRPADLSPNCGVPPDEIVLGCFVVGGFDFHATSLRWMSQVHTR